MFLDFPSNTPQNDQAKPNLRSILEHILDEESGDLEVFLQLTRANTMTECGYATICYPGFAFTLLIDDGIFVQLLDLHTVDDSHYKIKPCRDLFLGLQNKLRAVIFSNDDRKENK